MKIVDVLGVKSFHDGERIIMQVSFEKVEHGCISIGQQQQQSLQ